MKVESKTHERAVCYEGSGSQAVVSVLGGERHIEGLMVALTRVGVCFKPHG